LWGDSGKPVAPECTFAVDEGGFQQMGMRASRRLLEQKERKSNISSRRVCKKISQSSSPFVWMGQHYLLQSSSRGKVIL